VRKRRRGRDREDEDGSALGKREEKEEEERARKRGSTRVATSVEERGSMGGRDSGVGRPLWWRLKEPILS